MFCGISNKNLGAKRNFLVFGLMAIYGETLRLRKGETWHGCRYTHWILNAVCNWAVQNVTVVAIKFNACAEAVNTQLRGQWL
jgi:hypothetical protein